MCDWIECGRYKKNQRENYDFIWVIRCDSLALSGTGPISRSAINCVCVCMVAFVDFSPMQFGDRQKTGRRENINKSNQSALATATTNHRSEKKKHYRNEPQSYRTAISAERQTISVTMTTQHLSEIRQWLLSQKRCKKRFFFFFRTRHAQLACWSCECNKVTAMALIQQDFNGGAHLRGACELLPADRSKWNCQRDRCRSIGKRMQSEITRSQHARPIRVPLTIPEDDRATATREVDKGVTDWTEWNVFEAKMFVKTKVMTQPKRVEWLFDWH